MLLLLLLRHLMSELLLSILALFVKSSWPVGDVVTEIRSKHQLSGGKLVARLSGSKISSPQVWPTHLWGQHPQRVSLIYIVLSAFVSFLPTFYLISYIISLCSSYQHFFIDDIKFGLWVQIKSIPPSSCNSKQQQSNKR